MLGFNANNTYNIATTESKFGNVSTDYIMDGVRCGGTESHISLCTHQLFPNCRASEGAGVMCGIPGMSINHKTVFSSFFFIYLSIKNESIISLSSLIDLETKGSSFGFYREMRLRF